MRLERPIPHPSRERLALAANLPFPCAVTAVSTDDMKFIPQEHHARQYVPRSFRRLPPFPQAWFPSQARFVSEERKGYGPDIILSARHPLGVELLYRSMSASLRKRPRCCAAAN